MEKRKKEFFFDEDTLITSSSLHCYGVNTHNLYITCSYPDISFYEIQIKKNILVNLTGFVWDIFNTKYMMRWL